jgi:hypothetical protein
MLNYEQFLSSYPRSVDFGNLPSDPSLDYGLPIDIDDESSGGISYELTIDKLTGAIMPLAGSEKLPGMEYDGSFQTPNGIRYKVFNRREIDGTEYIQYIQPDGRDAIPGDAIKLPNGEVYRGKNNNVLYQQEPVLSSEAIEVESPGEMELTFIGIDEMDFDFGFASER